MSTALEANDKEYDILKKVLLRTPTAFGISHITSTDPVPGDTLCNLWGKWLKKLNGTP